MDKTLSATENTGQMEQEIYTFRVCVPKPVLRQFGEASRKEDNKSYIYNPTPTKSSWTENFAFDQGLLAGIPNSFVLKFPHDLSTIQVSHPQTAWKGEATRLDVTGMNISFLVSGVQHHSTEMTSNKSNCYTVNCPDRIWPETVDEVKIEITITQFTKLELVVSNTSSLRSGIVGPKSGNMDVSKYLLSTELSDVSLKCGTETFPAHAFILGHHSAVFAKMFEHDMKERKDRFVEIQGFEANSVREMLRFFYTSKVENMDEIVRFQLYELADIYLVQSLKAYCANFLGKTVTPQNVLEAYYFSRKHDIQFLTALAKKVLYKNRKTFIKDYNGLLEFMKTVPRDYADDLFNLLMGSTETIG